MRVGQRACLYIHCHSAGGSNPSLVEARCLGLPIIAFDVAYNRETIENEAKYFKDSRQLQEIVAQLTERERTSLGEKVA